MMLEVYAEYVVLSDMLKEISAFSERGKCDRPNKKKNLIIITQRKTTRECLQKDSEDVERDS